MGNEKFLSHRLNGFDTEESSLQGLKNATKANIPYLEIDTRVSKDGVIYVNHDNFIKHQTGSISISHNSSVKIDNYIKKNNLKTIKLDLLLDVFSKRANRSQILMIDVKDYGFEQLHLNLVGKYNLQKNIIWVSWIPQTLIEIDKISPDSTKILSFVPVNDAFASITKNITIKKIPFINVVLIGKDYFNKDLKNHAYGFQHAYLSAQLNQRLITLLAKNGGGVCISKKILTKNQLDFNKLHGLKTAVFSAQDRNEYNALSKKGVDIIFCDFIDAQVVA